MNSSCRCDLDLGLATKVQQLLFPKSSPSCNWCCIGVQNLMAQGLGGDYFDFLEMPDDCQAVFIGDVTGHGLHASVVMSLLYGFIHRSAKVACDPLDLVVQANDFLLSFAARSKEFDHFFSSTLFWGIIEPETLKMTYVNAGHPAPLVRRQGKILALPPTAPPVGFFSQPEISVGSFQFHKEDRFLLYTDGIPEALGADGMPFGINRLEALLLNQQGDHLQCLETLFAAVQEFSGKENPEDDRTAIAIDFHSW